MIVVGSVTNISVGKLFIAGIIPGVLTGLALMVCAYFMCRKYGWGADDVTNFSVRELLRAFYKAGLALIAPIIIIGGLLLGVFTPTEAAAVAAAYCLIVGLFIYRTIRLKDLGPIFTEAAASTALVMFIIGCSECFSWLLTRYNFPALLGEKLLGVSDNQAFILFIIFAVFTIGGIFLDGTPLVIMMVPILYPIALQAGIDPLVFGIFIVINVAVGGVSPPVGAPLFVACAVAEVKIEETFWLCMPFLVAVAVVSILCAAVPALCTWLPSLMG
jgi:C4-dicarboxylate transporter DctM subunit